MTLPTSLILSWHPHLTIHGRDHDRGTIATIAALLLAGGVVFGITTIVVDVGQLYTARQHLQTGADAAAIAVARACAVSPDRCDQQSSIATTRIVNNQPGGFVVTICGTMPGLRPCQAPPQNVTACVGTPPQMPYAEIRAAVIVTTTFANTMTTGSNTRQSRVAACARAALAPPLATEGLALTVSDCEFDSLTARGTAYTPAPTGLVHDPAARNAEGVIFFHTTDTSGACVPAGASGSDTPGGFGWLNQDDGTCNTTVRSDSTYRASTGVSASRACGTALATARATLEPQVIPVFRSATGTGNGTTYTLSRPSAFVITGYRFPSLSAASTIPGSTACPSGGNGGNGGNGGHGGNSSSSASSGSDTYLCGYFVEYTGSGMPGAGSDNGYTVIGLVG